MRVLSREVNSFFLLLAAALLFSYSNEFDAELTFVYALSVLIFHFLCLPIALLLSWSERVLVGGGGEGSEDVDSGESAFYRFVIGLIRISIYALIALFVVFSPTFKILSLSVGAEEANRYPSLWSHWKSTWVDTQPTGAGSDGEEELRAKLRTIELHGLQLSYEELARFPDRHKGKPVRLIGKVVQEQGQRTFRIDLTRKEYGWSDAIYVNLKGSAPKERILEGDEVLILGYADGLETYTAVLGNSVTLPKVRALSVSTLRGSQGSELIDDAAAHSTRRTPQSRPDVDNAYSRTTHKFDTLAGSITRVWKGTFPISGDVTISLNSQPIYSGRDHFQFTEFTPLKRTQDFEYWIFVTENGGVACEHHAVLVVSKKSAVVRELDSCDSMESIIPRLVLVGFDVTIPTRKVP